MNTTLAVFALAASITIAPALAGEMQDGHCDGAADPNFICGPVNAEDLVRIPGSDWVLASGMAGPGVEHGIIYLLNARDHRWRGIDLDTVAEGHDQTLYPDCPDKPTSAAFRGHGMALVRNDRGVKLLAINHGGRESVEIFDVGLGRTEPSLSWVGCVIAPQHAQLNSVVGLPGNGLAVTKFFDASDKGWVEDLFAGKPTGSVLEWSPGKGWNEVEDTAMSGPNGLAVTSDAGAYFVTEWGARKLHRIARAAVKHDVVDTGVLADNIHWDGDGKLLLTGQDVADKPAYAACALSEARVCPDAFKVLRVDPGTLTFEEVVSMAGTKDFGSGTTALDVGPEYWVGTWRGNRIARFAKP